MAYTQLSYFGYGQSDPPVVSAVGDQIYCPLSEQNIVTSFSITDTDSSGTSAFYIQVSTGYVFGEDELILNGNHPNINSAWEPDTAKLTFTPSVGSEITYSDIIAAVYDVVFLSSNPNVGPKTFSLTVGEANFLSNGHYYEFVPSQLITWTAARAQAESMTYYGLQGYLATITDEAEAQICGELSPGTGWIGGSDEEVEGVWKWVTGPEAGTVFWNGNQNGSAPPNMYANWNTAEPNNAGNEDYAHITDDSIGIEGSWNDLPDNTTGQGPYESKGFLVEYGGMPNDPVLSISATTTFTPPQITSTQPSTSCSDEIANLQATSNTNDIYWYDSPTGGTLLATGNTYTPILSADTTFWVLASNDGCTDGNRVAIEATVIQPNATVFDPIDALCIGSPNPLSNTDLNGVTGHWTPNFDPNATNTYTFTPDAGQCASSSTATIVINPLTTPNFTQIADVCEGSSLSLPNTSNNNITGSWSPAFDSTTTTTYTFTPDPAQCADTTTMTVGIIAQITPTFNPTPAVCEGTSITLAQTSNEGITGNWTPSFDSSNTTTYTFTPDPNQCASTTTKTIVVRPSVVPVFDALGPFCNGDNVGSLPNISNNGIAGTWSPNTIDNTSTTTYVFTPDDQSNCEVESTMTITILNQVTPTFNLNDICIGETIAPLPTTSNEGITGIWFPAPNNLTTTTYTFTPNPNQCASITSETITVNPINSLAIEVENTSEPFAPNQIIEVLVSGGSGNYEYQLDGGDWQTDSSFENVIGCDTHTVKVRDMEGCSNEPEKTATILSYPKFFTPNGDGFNDFWTIKCLQTQTGMISIFDRFGKLIKQFKTTSQGWNGTYNNALMPTSDYWFVVRFFDDSGIEREFRSHFTLRR